MTKIEWTKIEGKPGETWNPLVGCTKISPGCANCYAEVMAKRLAAMGQENYAKVIGPNGRWNGSIQLVESALDKPIKKRVPTTFFVNSMSDLFHRDVPLWYIQKVFEVMNKTPHHTYQILTKRPERLSILRRYLNWTPNIWIGVSIENQQQTERIELLRLVPAQIRFLSCEPLLEPLELNLRGIHWVIAGGESGPNARPCDQHWIVSIVRQCYQQKVPVFVKQLGSRSLVDTRVVKLVDRKGADMSEWPTLLQVRQFPS